MKVKTFHALTMQDAIRAIKAELGPDAVILSSREVRHGGRIMSYFNKPVLEVMAAAEDDPLPAVSLSKPVEPAPVAKKPEARPVEAPTPKAPAPQPVSKEAFHATLQSLLATPTPTPSSSSPATRSTPVAAPVDRPATAATPARPTPWKRERIQALRQELRALSQQLSASLPVEVQSLGAHMNPEMATFCRNLVTQGLRPSTADRLGHELTAMGMHPGTQPLEGQQAALASVMAKDIRVSGPLLSGAGDRAVAIMMGTSGVGKTTCLTKLAAHYRLEEKKSVAIITLDTYRPASVEQVRMYAKVLGIPFASATSVKQAADGVRRQAHADVVLIDTAGFSDGDVAGVHELHRALRDEPEVQTHLVVSAATRDQDLQRQLARVNDLPLLRLLFTKLDETEAFGALYDLAYHAGIPLSYWSAGQRVPEDLEVATPQRLAEFIVRRRYSVAVSGASLDSGATTLPRTTIQSDMTGLVRG